MGVRKLFVFLVFFTVTLAGSNLSPSLASENIKGWGAYSCIELYDDFGKADQTVKTVIAHGAAQWVMGYMSARNLELDKADQRDLTSMFPNQVMAEIDAKCRINTSLMVYEIAEIIYQSLPYCEDIGANNLS